MSDHDHSHGADGSDDGAVHSHISSVAFYAGILAVLMMLTLLTVGVSYVHLGRLNLMVAIVIASIKAGLVVTFFMHLKYDNRFNATILIVSLLFIGVFFAYTMNDTEHRAGIDLDQGGKYYDTTGVPAPGGMERAEHTEGAEHEPGAAGAAGGGGDGEHTAAPAPEHH